MTDSRAAAMDMAGVKVAEHIVVPAVAGRDSDMNVSEQCVVRLVEATHNVEGFDGSTCTAERDHLASSPVPAGEVDHGSE
jgi:hypothetical protein